MTRTSEFCMNKITRGRYVGRTCVNAAPCYDHAVRPLALNMQALGPDEYPFEFYVVMARQRLTGFSPTGRRIRDRESPLW